MRVAETPLAGAYLLEIEPQSDERGFFARVWCTQELQVIGVPGFAQASVSHNRRLGTVRGMHFAWPPAREAKLVRCERGAVHDVVIDLRPQSSTFLQHFAAVLSADRANALYVPPGLAHGFQTLDDDTTVGYVMTEAYIPGLSHGFRYDDPAFGIAWPLPVSCIVERDRTYPDFDATEYRARHSAQTELR